MQTRQKATASKPSSVSTRSRTTSVAASSTPKAKPGPGPKSKPKGKKDTTSAGPAEKAPSMGKGGKKGASTAAPKPLTKEEVKLLNELKSRQGSSAAAAQAAEDANICKRNNEMLAAEASDEEEESNQNGQPSDKDLPSAPPPKKQRVAPPTQPSQPSPLDSDEENFAAGLSDPIEIDLDGSENGTPSDEEEVIDEYLGASHSQAVDIDVVDDQSNGISVKIEDLDVKPNHHRHRRSQSATSASATTSSSAPASKSSKITSSDFSPISYKLAAAAKTRLRFRLSVENAFPDNLNRDIFIWQSVSQAAKMGGEESFLVDAFKRSESNSERQQMLIEYTWYARGSILGDIKSRAISFISQYYKIPGNLTKKQITDGVNWLIAAGHFKFFGADPTTRTYDKQQPFYNTIITDVIRAQWFTNQSKGDCLTFQLMVKEKAIPVALIILVTTAVEHALKEWISGSRVKVHFTDDVARNRYNYHFGAWNKIKGECPNWGNLFPKQLFLDVINGCDMSHLAENCDEEAMEELDDIDFSALENLAKEGKIKEELTEAA